MTSRYTRHPQTHLPHLERNDVEKYRFVGGLPVDLDQMGYQFLKLWAGTAMVNRHNIDACQRGGALMLTMSVGYWPAQ